MDINIINTILRLCVEQQTCLFEVPILSDYCLEKRICTHAKHVLASINNYTNIFKISRDRNRIELFMPVRTSLQSFINLLLIFICSSSCVVAIAWIIVHQMRNHGVQIFIFVTNISVRMPVVGTITAHILTISRKTITEKI